MEVPGARFSRAVGHKLGNLLGILPSVSVSHLKIKDVSLMKIKFLLLSSQLLYISENTKFREIFINYKSNEEDLKEYLQSAMRGLESNEHLHFSDYGVIYGYQN